MQRSTLACVAMLIASASSFGVVPSPLSVDRRPTAARASVPEMGMLRRSVMAGAAALLTAASVAPDAAMASGGATAGKYTTIPIAKRRYFGRVKQGVFEFLAVGRAIKKGELDSADVTEFFADNIQVQEKRRKRQCVGGYESCNVKEKFSSRSAPAARPGASSPSLPRACTAYAVRALACKLWPKPTSHRPPLNVLVAVGGRT